MDKSKQFSIIIPLTNFEGKKSTHAGDFHVTAWFNSITHGEVSFDLDSIQFVAKDGSQIDYIPIYKLNQSECRENYSSEGNDLINCAIVAHCEKNFSEPDEVTEREYNEDIFDNIPERIAAITDWYRLLNNIPHFSHAKAS